MKSIRYLGLLVAFSAAVARGDNSLMRALAAGDIESVKLLLRGGEDPMRARSTICPPSPFR